MFSRSFIEEALGATFDGKAPDVFDGVSTDSRNVAGGALFVPLVGERFDGHSFVAPAMKAGAGGALFAKGAAMPDGGKGAPLLRVDDTLVALQELAAAHLARSSARRVALTGSNGKTTTKDLIRTVLSACLGPDAVLATEGNLNNHIGLPLTALRLDGGHRAAVLEMGMNHLGEIARLCEIAKPELALVTNVGFAHAGPLGGIEGVQQAKGEIFAGLVGGGLALVNADDERCVRAASVVPAERRIRFGRGADVDVGFRLLDDADASGLSLDFVHGGRTRRVRLPLEGEHNASNAAAAVAVAVGLELDFEAAVDGLASAEAPAGRLRRVTSKTGALVLDDTYNANPDSMRAGFAALGRVAGDRRRVMALGQMLELGPDAEAMHRDIGRDAVMAGAGHLFACGELGRFYVEGARQAGLADTRISWAEDSAALAPLVASAVSTADAILCKGSRGARMERVVHALLADGDD